MRSYTTFIAGVLILFVGATAGTAQSTQYGQNFDAVDAPDLPPGWSSPENAWAASASVPSSGSGGNNIENKGNAPGTVVSPVFDFSAVTTASIAYFARRTATYDSLNIRLEASLDGGSTWTIVIVDSTAGLPAAPSTYGAVEAPIPSTLMGEAAVRFRLRALRTTGGNVRVDDVSIIADGPMAWNRLGFGERSSTSTENSEAFVVPLGLTLIPSSDGLQGIQFRVTLSPGLSLVSLVAGPAGLGSPEWHISYEIDGSSVQVVAIAEGTQGLPPVMTDSLFLISVSTLPLGPSQSRLDSLAIRDVVASAASETGEDLFLDVDPAVHELRVLPQAPHLQVDSSAVHFGTIASDSTAEALIVLTNVGAGTLEVADAYSISGLLGVDPTFLTLESGLSSVMTITVEGSLYGTGPVEDWLVLEHNASTSPDTIAIIGEVTGEDSRGDVNDDGSVDIVDLVLGIDLILGRIELPERQQRLDLHPFPVGNGAVDVRDLTVLAQAIALGVWPDGAPIPGLESQLAKSDAIVGDLIIRRDLETVELWTRSSDPLRAIHVAARVYQQDAMIRANQDLPAIHVGQPYAGYGTGSFSLLTFGMDGPPVASYEPVLLATLDLPLGVDLEIISSVAVDRSIRRRSLVSVIESSEPPSQPDQTIFGPPYPNPVDPGFSALVHFPLTLGESGLISVHVTDVLGRSIRNWRRQYEKGVRVEAWDLRAADGRTAPPGLYFATVAAGERRQTRSVTIR